MGYKGERASLNQFTKLSEYLENSGALEQAKTLIEITEEFKAGIEKTSGKLDMLEVNEDEKPFEYVSFDAGMARFFKDSPYELVVLKLAGDASSEEEKKRLLNLLEPEYLHIFSGPVKNPNVFKDLTKAESKRGALLLAQLQVERLFESSLLKGLDEQMNSHFAGSFAKDVKDYLKASMKVPEVDNLARDLAEWRFILRAMEALKGQETLIVKDGSLILNPVGLTSPIYQRLKSIFLGEKKEFSNLVVGIVKESRFLKDQGHVVSRMIWHYARTSMDQHQFFKIPGDLDLVLDESREEDRAIERYFLSIFFGKNVFEIQFPKALVRDVKNFERVKVTLLKQITSLYGGSLIGNSLAHRAASLSEAESRALEKDITSKIFGENK